jgi:hypothetical protein
MEKLVYKNLTQECYFSIFQNLVELLNQHLSIQILLNHLYCLF